MTISLAPKLLKLSLLAVLCGSAKSPDPPLLSVQSLAIDDEAFPLHFTVTGRNDGGPALVDYVGFARLHTTPDDPPLVAFAAKNDSDSQTIGGRQTSTLEFDLKPLGETEARLSVVYARIVGRYLESPVFQTEPQVFMLQRSETALDKALAGAVDPEFVKAGLAEIAGFRGNEAPGYVKFKAMLAEAAGKTP